MIALIDDPAGNRTIMNDRGTVTTFTYSNANRLTLANANGVLTTYTNDLAGNRTSMEQTLGTSRYTTMYTWDAAGNMTVAEPPAGTVTFTYNAMDQRVLKDTGSVSGYLYDHKKLLAETDGESITSLYTTTTDQEYGDLIDEDGGDATHLYDAQANTNTLLDASGNVLAQYKYYAFGNIASYSIDGAPWSNLDTNAWNQMTSEQWADLTPGEGSTKMLAGGKKQYFLDEETTLYMLGMGNNQGRSLDSSTARLTSEDPIRQASGDVNLYPIVENNPVNRIDPSGHGPPVLPKEGYPSQAEIDAANDYYFSARLAAQGSDAKAAVDRQQGQYMDQLGELLFKQTSARRHRVFPAKLADQLDADDLAARKREAQWRADEKAEDAALAAAPNNEARAAIGNAAVAKSQAQLAAFNEDLARKKRDKEEADRILAQKQHDQTIFEIEHNPDHDEITLSPESQDIANRVGGLAEASLGAAGFLTPAGWVASAYTFDHFVAGLRQMKDGGNSKTVLRAVIEAGLTKAGASPAESQKIATVVDVIVGVGVEGSRDVARKVARDGAGVAKVIAKAEAAEGVIRSSQPIQETIKNVADDALVHFGKSEYSIIEPNTAGSSRWFRYGDIKHLAPSQIEGLIGDMAESGIPGNAKIMHVLESGAIPKSAFARPYAAGFKEYFVPEQVKPSMRVKIQD